MSTTYFASITTPVDTYYMPYDEHSWTLEGGFHAPRQEWKVPKDLALQVLSDLAGLSGLAAEVSLQFGDVDDPITVNRVIVLRLASANDVEFRKIVFTDVRYYFEAAWLAFDANYRRRVGDSRLVADTIETGVVIADTVAYAKWSTNSSLAYDWSALKEQILGYMTLGRHGRPDISFVTDSLSIDLSFTDPVQETSSDGPANVGLARAIETFGGVGIYVDLAGVIHVYDKVPGSEAAFLATVTYPELWQHGSLVWVDRSRERPAASAHSYRCYVDYEIECRFTYNMTGSGIGSARAPGDPFLDMVLQVTDLSLVIPAGPWGDERTVGQGTWITFEEAFAAWGGVTYEFDSGDLSLPPLTDDIVARHWFGESLQHYTVGQSRDTFDAQWAGRIGQVMKCYRTYFRVDPQFWDYIRHSWTIRAAVWDPTTAARSAAPVYSNYNLTPSNYHLSPDIKRFGLNHEESYPESGLLNDGQPSGFEVKEVDQELGIFMVDRDLSKYPGHMAIAPSPTQEEAGPDEAASIKELPDQQLQLRDDGDGGGWKLAMILSCAPASPNDLRRMYEIQVSLTDAASTGGLSATPSGHAPDQELRGQISEARVAWSDDGTTSLEILSVLGAGDGTPDIGSDEPITTLVPINLEQELQPLGKAKAAAELMAKLDHYEGAVAIPQHSGLVPIGSILKVIHVVTEDGAVSVLVAPGATIPFHSEDFLKGSARNYLLKQVAQGR